VQENEGIENKPRRKRRSREQIAKLVREFKASGLSQRKFSENHGIALSELQRSLKIVRRASQPELMAVQIEAAERNDGALLNNLEQSYPGLKRICDKENNIRRFVNVFLKSKIFGFFKTLRRPLNEVIK
jgi:hypothetical protein